MKGKKSRIKQSLSVDDFLAEADEDYMNLEFELGID